MTNRGSVLNLCLSTVLLLLLSVTGAFGQNVTGTILGIVTDASGAVVPSATVTVINEGTNIEYKMVTGSAGEYSVPNLPPGTYSIKVEVKGFKPSLTKGMPILANRSARVDVVLQPGAVTETVEVQASAPVVNSEDATIGNVLESGVIASIPLNGRSLDRLIRISAGVTTDSASNPRVAGSSYWGGMQMTVDGATFNDTGNGGASYSYRHGLSTTPSVDAISEFKMDSNNQKAEFEGSVSVTVVTKSGTNELHGSMFFFNRNKAYAAKSYFSTGSPKPMFNRNEFGITAGGPVYIPNAYDGRNRTFFFAGYEGLRERSPSSDMVTSVATQAMRDGNFTGLPVLRDPLSGIPFTNNQIPSSRMDSRAKTLIGFVPLPNSTPSGPAGTLNNYRWRNKNLYDINRYNVRIDHRFSDKDSIWVNLNRSASGPYSVSAGYPENYGNWADAGYSTYNGSLTWNRTITPTTLNEARVTYLSHSSVRQGLNRDFDPRTIFPDLHEVTYGGLPYIAISNHVAIGDYGGSDPGRQLTPQFIDNVTLVRGKHTIKFGVDLAMNRVFSPPSVAGLGSGLANNAGLGRFTFTGLYTRYDTSTSAQPAHSFADFLLGYPVTTYRSTTSPNMLFYAPRYSFFVQDDWKVTPKLSISYGVRYMYQTPWQERDDTISNFDPSTGQLVVYAKEWPAQTRMPLVSAFPVVLAGKAGIDTKDISSDRNNFGPRLGMAYRPFGDSKTVFRAGFGVYYNFLPVYIGYRQRGFNNVPFLLAETYDSDGTTTPSITLAAPFAGSSTIASNPSLTAVQKDIKNSESYQWNFTMERELRANLGLRVSYVGNRGTHLPWYNYPINVSKEQIPGSLQPNRPYQPWSDINILASGGNSIMHQLQIEAIQRYSNGLSFQLEYSWNRSLDDVPVVGGPQNPYNARIDRGNSDQIRRHIFTAAYSYELPFGPGKKFLNQNNVFTKHVIGGWQVAGITYLRTGTPFSLSFSATSSGWRGGRPSAVEGADIYPEEKTLARWFNPAAFYVPATYTWGNAARNMLFGPGDIVIDLSALKDISFTERVKGQFRAEFFNMPNHFNWGNPATNISTTGTVGKISGGGDPRQIQFGLKLLF